MTGVLTVGVHSFVLVRYVSYLDHKGTWTEFRLCPGHERYNT